jgi:alkylation response protein AidB-like acyl-CoA dehydrogenase
VTATVLTTRAERRELADTVRKFLGAECTEAHVRRAVDSGDGFDRRLWHRMGQELGLQGLAVPEEFGGAGFGCLEQAVVFIEAGRFLLPAPLLTSAVLATQLLLASGDAETYKELLAGLCSGDLIATVAPPAADGGFDLSRTVCRAQFADIVRVEGELSFVPWAHVSDTIVVFAASPQGVGLFAVARDQPGVSVTPQETLDPTRPVHRVRLDAASARPIGDPDRAGAILDAALPVFLSALAAESVGVARHALDLAVEYAKVREQYGRLIGSFQVVKHRCADILLAVEGATSSAEAAAAAVAGGAPDRVTLAHLAAAQCTDAAVYATTESIELHGGIAYTWEHPAHLYYKRALSSAALFGSGSTHRARLVDEIARTRADAEHHAERPESAPARELLALATDDAERDFAQEALRFLTDNARPRVAASSRWGEGDEGLTLFHESSGQQERDEARAAQDWQRQRWAAGYGWITGPPRFGGRGLSASYERLYRMIEGAFEIPDMNPIRIGLSTVGHAITDFGTDEQVERYAAGIRRGDVIACQLFSEPEAGSDLAGVRSRALRRDDGWHIDGQKVWTSNGTFADLGLALVRTDREAPKHRGLTMFLVPMDTPGIDVRPLRQLTGGASFCEVFLTDVVVDDGMRLGPEGDGWKVATKTLAAERRSTGDRNHETNARAVELLWQLVVRSGRDADPSVRDAWAQVFTRVQTARFQQVRMEAVPDDELIGTERAIDKLFLVQSLRAIGELAAQLLGPSFVADTGEWGTYGWNRWLMGALGYRIAGGTDEVLRIMLAERLLGLPREPR